MRGAAATKWNERPKMPGTSGVGGGLGEYPVLSPLYRVTELKAQVDDIISKHDQGDFGRSAGMVDEMKTDDRLLALMGTRTAGRRRGQGWPR